jgi:mannose-6-phosphate isomerase
MLYPMIFNDVYKAYIWGGRSLSGFGKNLPNEGIVAESWEISAHPNGPSIITNGALSGNSLEEILKQYPEELLGDFNYRPYSEKFPLLIKLIDACEDLSVQVHPNDRQAYDLENGELGKNEMWYIVAAEPGSKLVIGTADGIDKETFTSAVLNGEASSCLREIEVQAGDVVDIPAGLLHAIGKGNVICEIQQNSDTTYRVYDYERRDASGNSRPLHIEKALEVINFDLGDDVIKKPITIFAREDNEHTDKIELLVLNDYFKTEHWLIENEISSEDNISRFSAITVLNGSGKLHYADENEIEQIIELSAGRSVLIPAITSKWRISGKLDLLRATLPHPVDHSLL